MSNSYSRAGLRRGLLLLGLLGGGFSAQAQLSGTYYVGAGTSPNPARTYADLPAAVTALGAGVSGPVTFQLLDASYTLSSALTVPVISGSSAANTVRFVPAAGSAPVIAGNVAGAMLVLNGADYLSFDGYDGSTAARTITLRNAGNGPAVQLQNDATYNTLRYLTLESAASGLNGGNTTTGTVYFGTSAPGGTGNDFNLLSHCDVRAVSNSATSVPTGAVFSLGTGAASSGVPASTANSDNTVQSCNIYNFSAGGIYLNDTGNGGSWTVSGNNLYQTAARTTAIRVIRLTSGSGHVVTGNNIYQTAGGQSSVWYGIALAGGAAGATISGNSIGGSAAGATGSPMSFSGSGLVYPMYLSLGTSTPTSIQGNVVRNISSASTGTGYGIDLVAGAVTMGTVAPNIIGSTVSGQGISHAGPLYGIHVEGASTATIQNNTFAGLSTTAGLLTAAYLSGSGAATISGNTIAGLSSNLATAAPLAGIQSTGSGVVTITNNTISDISQSGLTSNLYGLQNNFVAGSNVSGNTITNVTYAGPTAGNTVYGVWAGGNSTISNNTVTTVQATGSSKANLRGIYIGGTGATPTVTDNQVTGVLNSTTGADVQSIGLYVGPTSGTMGAAVIRGNRISNVGTVNTAATGSTNVVTGLQVGALGGGSVIERNRVWNVYGGSAGTGANADAVRGLAVIGSSSGTFANNQISLAAGVAGQLSYGMLDASANGTNNFTYNSVLVPAAPAAAATSYAFYRSATTTPPGGTLRNNLLYNGRTAASGSTAYAIGTASTTAWTATTSNYNLLIGPDATAIGAWAGTALSFAGWKAAQPTGSGGDASSLSVPSSSAPAASLFADVTTGNLDLNPVSPEAWYANGNGVQLTGQTADYGSATAGRSVSVATGGTDIGADEFTPTATPPALTVSAAPVLGGTQTFSLGGRTLATLTYAATGTVPTSVAGRYYSGANPLNPLPNARYQNSYLRLEPTGGAGFTYDLTLYYDDALLGPVAPETALRLSRRDAVAGFYEFYPQSTVDAADNTLTQSELVAFGDFTGSDQAAPLPVTLTGFAAFRVGPNAQLTWNTATEKNSAGYEVQVSGDGRTFRALGFVRSTLPNSTTMQFYQFTDLEDGKQGLRYYRLRQLDLDGQFSYSPVQTVSFGSKAAAPLLLAAPNPFAQELTLTLTAANPAPARLTIRSATGRVVYARELALPGGSQRLTLPQLGQLPAGLYVVQLTTDGQVQRVKVVKQ